MSKKSTIREAVCLVASLNPIMLVHKGTEIEDVQNIETLYKYAVELFNGIAGNESNNFSGKFDLSILLTPSQFLIYKKIKGASVTEQEYEEFMTAISILQMVFIDENIYLTGIVELKNLFISKEGIIWGVSAVGNNDTVKIIIGDSLIKQFGRKFVKSICECNVLDFLPTVYRFNPFKEEKGNMMRHIVNPLNSVKDSNAELLSELIEYCKQYIEEKNFELEL